MSAPTWAQDDAVNGNGGAAANDSSLAANVLNDEVEGDDGAAANSTTDAVSVAVNDTLNGLGNDDEVEGQAAANDDSTAVAVKDTLNDNELFNAKQEGSENNANNGSEIETNKQDAGENAANNGGEIELNKLDAGENAANNGGEVETNKQDAGENAANNGGEVETNKQDAGNNAANNGGEITTQDGQANANNGGFALRINDIFVAVSVVDLDATVTGNNPNINMVTTFTTGDNTVNSGTTFEVNGISQINQNSGFYNVAQQSNSFAVTFQGPPPE
jgi:hypothetical protein